MSLEKCEKFRLRSFTDERGSLAVTEGGAELGMDIKRVFFIRDVPKGATRASHTELRTTECIINVSGSCGLKVSDGRNTREFRLGERMEAVSVPPGTWRELYDFSPDCVLAVLCDTHFDETEYVSGSPVPQEE